MSRKQSKSLEIETKGSNRHLSKDFAKEIFLAIHLLHSSTLPRASADISWRVWVLKKTIPISARSAWRHTRRRSSGIMQWHDDGQPKSRELRRCLGAPVAHQQGLLYLLALPRLLCPTKMFTAIVAIELLETAAHKTLFSLAASCLVARLYIYDGLEVTSKLIFLMTIETSTSQ